MNPDRFIRTLWSDRKLNLFVASAACASPDTRLQVGINDFEHVDRYEQMTSWLSAIEFRSFAKRHCEQTDHYLFTVVDADGPLLGYALAEANSAQSRFAEVDQTVRWPELTGTLYSAFVSPRARGRGIHDILRRARVNFLIGECGMRSAITAVEEHNSAAMQSARKANYFRLIATLRTRYRFGLARRSVEVSDRTFDAHFVDAEG